MVFSGFVFGGIRISVCCFFSVIIVDVNVIFIINFSCDVLEVIVSGIEESKVMVLVLLVCNWWVWIFGV